MFETQIGNNIAALRAKKNQSQSDLAAALGLPTKVIDDWERGVAVPNEDNLNRLAEHFGVTKYALCQKAIGEKPSPSARDSGGVRVYEIKTAGASAMYIIFGVAAVTLFLGLFLFPFLINVSALCLAISMVLFVICKEPAPKSRFLRRLGYAVIIAYYLWDFVSAFIPESQIGLAYLIIDYTIDLAFVPTLFFLFKNKRRPNNDSKVSRLFYVAVVGAVCCLICAALPIFSDNAAFPVLAAVFGIVYPICLVFAKQDKTAIKHM